MVHEQRRVWKGKNPVRKAERKEETGCEKIDPLFWFLRSDRGKCECDLDGADSKL